MAACKERLAGDGDGFMARTHLLNIQAGALPALV